MQFMLDRGIATRRGVMCAHREPAYRREHYRAAGPLAESEAAQDQAIILPLFHQMTSPEQDRVAETLTEAVAEFSESTDSVALPGSAAR